jgi:predicted metal-dependent peptidase
MSKDIREMDPQLKVSRAVTKAAFNIPFYGSFLLNVTLKETKEVETMATDGKFIYWNSDFVVELSEDETLFVLCHEVLHIVLLHCLPWKGKDPRLCNMAMDYIINSILVTYGLIIPDMALFDREDTYKGMAWQQVYAILADVKEKAKQQAESGGDLQNQDGDGSGAANNTLSREKQEQVAKDMESFTGDHVKQNDELSESEMEALKQTIERMAVSAAEAAKAAGKGLGALEGLIEDIRTPKVDWKARIRTNIKAANPDDYTFRKPNRKLLAASGIYFPSMESETIDTLVWALDTSASVTVEEQHEYLSEMNAISLELKPRKTLVMYVDADVAKVEEYEAGEEITQLNTRGGGGTSFVPVFEYLEYHGITPDHLVYASDMDVWSSCFPAFAPTFPVTWLSTRSDYNVPFGELILTKGLNNV